ncbi:MAG: alpha/beta hydrolase [Bacillota bacterium]|nr:alpha/beta hydrolase [Bacillota bacterium]MDW7684559.1 alpha/beta hydrolase [Bacillota bacterium]
MTLTPTARIRHAIVLSVWRLIERLGDHAAQKATLPDGVRICADIPYLDDGIPAHRLDVYSPKAVDGPLPVIIYFHGGGFVAGDKSHMRQYCMALANEGYVVFNINYRLAPVYKNPAQIEDVLAALAWIKVNGDSYQGDTNRIFLAGDSAGAYLAGLAAAVCTNGRLAAKLGLRPPLTEQDIRGVLFFCGLFDLQTASKRKFISLKSDIEMMTGTVDLRGLDNYSVLKNITANYPPVFISSGKVDGLHPESEQLISALAEKEINYTALLFDRSEKKAFHAFQQHLALHTAKQCMAEALNFLRQNV